VLRGSTVVVVIPARDEARFIGETVRGVPSWVDGIVVVDDGSRDDTAAIAGAQGRRIYCIRHPVARGVGAAIAAGYRRALELEADVVAVMAGDGQMHPDDLAAVVGPVVDRRADYAKGNRLDHPDVLRSMPPQRLAASLVLSRLTALACGLPGLRDSQSGYTAIARSALEALDLEALWPSYGYPNDLLAALARAGQRCVDVVVRPVYRGEASGLRPWHLATIGYLLGRALVRRVTEAPINRGAERTPASPRDAQVRPTTRGRSGPRGSATLQLPSSP
jgi:glycosyltransferase involved in cell wall biosynthesis